MARRKHKPLTIEFVPVPTKDADKKFAEAIDLLGAAIADQILEEARAECAAELGCDPEDLNREHDVELPTAFGGGR